MKLRKLKKTGVGNGVGRGAGVGGSNLEGASVTGFAVIVGDSVGDTVGGKGHDIG